MSLKPHLNFTTPAVQLTLMWHGREPQTSFNLLSSTELFARLEFETRRQWDGVLVYRGMSLIVGKPKAGK